MITIYQFFIFYWIKKVASHCMIWSVLVINLVMVVKLWGWKKIDDDPWRQIPWFLHFSWNWQFTNFSEEFRESWKCFWAKIGWNHLSSEAAQVILLRNDELCLSVFNFFWRPFWNRTQTNIRRATIHHRTKTFIKNTCIYISGSMLELDWWSQANLPKQSSSLS